VTYADWKPTPRRTYIKRDHKNPERIAEITADLRRAFPPGSTVYTVLRDVASSGMGRSVSVYSIDPETHEPVWQTYRVAVLLDSRWDERREAIRQPGCGYDVGFDLAYSLGRVLYRDGFQCVGDGCPSNDHSNGDRGRTPHEHSDPGYSLRHRWIN
jgi:hypothetical protein